MHQSLARTLLNQRILLHFIHTYIHTIHRIVSIFIFEFLLRIKKHAGTRMEFVLQINHFKFFSCKFFFLGLVTPNVMFDCVAKAQISFDFDLFNYAYFDGVKE